MRIPEEVITRINNETDIVALVSEYVNLEQSGQSYKGLCPFHNENTPSFIVTPSKQLAHCFGCHKGGSPINFLMEIEDISFTTAVQKLAKKLNIELNIEDRSSVNSQEHTMIKMHEYLTNLYHHILMNTKEGESGLNYLLERGFSLDLIKSEKLGITPNMYHFTKSALEEQNFPLELAYRAGLLLRNEEDFTYFDRFHGRIMIPIRNHHGNYVGFTSRSLNGDMPKYLNTPETPIFKKRELLYNLHDARKSIRKQDEIILMEGHLDILKVKMIGVTNIVGNMGTQLSNENTSTIKRMSQNVTLMFDGDRSGRDAQNEIGLKLLQQGVNTYVISLPDDTDPDEFIEKNGSESFLNYTKHNKKSYVIHIADERLEESMNDEKMYNDTIQLLTKYVGYIKNDVLVERTVNYIAKKYQLESSTLFKQIPKHQTQFKVNNKRATERRSLRDRKEQYLLKCIIDHPELIKNVEEENVSNILTSRTYYDIFIKLREHLSEYEEFQYSNFYSLLDDEEGRVFQKIYQIATGGYTTHDVFNDYIEDLSGIKDYRNEKKALESRFEQAKKDHNTELQLDLLNQLININRKFK